MLKSIRLDRFKKFKSNLITLKPYTILMGENSSGKTTILQAIYLALSTFSQSELITVKSGKTYVRSKGIGLTELPGINISDFRELYYGKISRQGKQVKVDSSNIGALISLQDERDNIYKLQISSLFGGFNLKTLSTNKDLASNPDMQQYQPLLISGFVGLQMTEERSFPVAIRHRLSSGNASFVIRNLVLDLKKNESEKYLMLKHRMNKDFNFVLDDIIFDEQRDLFIKASYSDSLDDRLLSLDFNSSGSGYMQILQILTPIYTLCPDKCRVVLLDEPDAHLHPNMQIALARSLRQIQKELNIQIIISTHSAAIIKTASPSEVIPISSENEINTPLTNSHEVDDYIGQLDNYELAKTVISGKLIFFEDQNTEAFEVFDKVGNTHCFYGVNTAAIYKGRSKDDKTPFQIKPLLKQFLGKDIEVHFVRDGDGLNNVWRDKIMEYAESKNIKLHLLSQHEIENYILNGNLIFRALQNKYPQKDIPNVDAITNKIKGYLLDTIKLRQYKYDDNLEDSIYKTANLLSIDEYRNFLKTKSEAESLCVEYEQYTELDDLLRVGMGKEALKLLFKWINSLGFNLCKDDIYEVITANDIPKEISEILSYLRSSVYKGDTSGLPEYEYVDDELINNDEDLGDFAIDEILQLRFKC